MTTPTPACPCSPGRAAVVAGLVLVAFALWLVSDHLDDELWNDEAYALLHYADEGPTKPFLVYDLPNNHVLLSSALVVWKGALGDDVFTLRLLPALAFLGALVLVVVAVERLAGSLRAGLLAGVLLATSHVVLVHATLLRGYGPAELPVAGALLALAGWRRRPRVGSAIAYVVCGALAVGLVPTNALALVVLGGWALVAAAAGAGRRDVARTATLAALALAAGGVSYAAIAREVLRAAGAVRTGLSAAGALGQFGADVLLDVAWLLPLAVVGAALLARRARLEGRGSLELGRPGGALALLACVVVLPAAVFALLPTAPFPRTLVPLSPLLFAALALAIEPALEAADRRRARAGWALFAVVAAALGGAAVWRERLRAWRPVFPDAGPAIAEYDPYFRHDGFQPGLTVARLEELARAGPLVALVDDADVWAILVHWRADTPAALYVADGTPMQDELRARASRSTVVLVAPGAARARRLADMAGLPPSTRLERIESPGLFELHRVVR